MCYIYMYSISSKNVNDGYKNMNFPGGQRRLPCTCSEVAMVKNKEGREMLQCFIYCRMAEGKSFRNVNSVSNMGS